MFSELGATGLAHRHEDCVAARPASGGITAELQSLEASVSSRRCMVNFMHRRCVAHIYHGLHSKFDGTALLR